mgnify:FL=1
MWKRLLNTILLILKLAKSKGLFHKTSGISPRRVPRDLPPDE